MEVPFYVDYLVKLSPEISKNRSKKPVSLAKILSRFFVRSPVGDKRDTGGKTLPMVVPVVVTPPSRKAFFTNV